MLIVETERLLIREMVPEDATFILELLNEPSFHEFIGDRGVRSVGDARAYIENGPLASYARHGHGLYLTLLKDGDVPIGMTGLIKREGLADVDIGYAFRPQFWSRGYGFEATTAVLAYGRHTLGLKRVVAIVSPENYRSIKVLEKLGLQLEGMIRLPGDSQAVMLFAAEG
jgi:RimJ/RimL family protein N-acetyltransferase